MLDQMEGLLKPSPVLSALPDAENEFVRRLFLCIAALREKDLTCGKRQLLRVKIAVAQVRFWPELT
jgi:hypothetical protein